MCGGANQEATIISRVPQRASKARSWSQLHECVCKRVEAGHSSHASTIPNTWEVEVRGSRVWGQPGLHSPCLENEKEIELRKGWKCSSVVEHMQEAPNSVPIRQGWRCAAAILVLERWRQGDQKLRVILSCILSWRPVWAIWEPISKKNNTKLYTGKNIICTHLYTAFEIGSVCLASRKEVPTHLPTWTNNKVINLIMKYSSCQSQRQTPQSPASVRFKLTEAKEESSCFQGLGGEWEVLMISLGAEFQFCKTESSVGGWRGQLSNTVNMLMARIPHSWKDYHGSYMHFIYVKEKLF